jgi:hypothetical protein
LQTPLSHILPDATQFWQLFPFWPQFVSNLPGWHLPFESQHPRRHPLHAVAASLPLSEASVPPPLLMPLSDASPAPPASMLPPSETSITPLLVAPSLEVPPPLLPIPPLEAFPPLLLEFPLLAPLLLDAPLLELADGSPSPWTLPSSSDVAPPAPVSGPSASMPRAHAATRTATPSTHALSLLMMPVTRGAGS